VIGIEQISQVLSGKHAVAVVGGEVM